MLPDDPRHGQIAGYGAGCRSICCKKAMSDYENRRRLLQMKGVDRRVSRDGSIRRLRALQALGWPSPVLSAEMGRSRNYVSAFVTRTGVATVRADVAEDIAALFDRLCMTPGPSSTTAARSARAGWLPPLAWDDLDEPYADTKIGQEATGDVDDVLVGRILAGDYSLAGSANKAERAAVSSTWRSAGRSLNDLERKTGWNVHRDLRAAA